MIRQAVKLSHQSQCSTKHGAIVACKKSVLGRGVNSNKSHPIWGSDRLHGKTHLPMYTLHAEAAAIRDAVRRGADLKGSTIFVARSTEGLSRPCTSCLRLIRKYGISKIVYTKGDGTVSTEWPPVAL